MEVTLRHPQRTFSPSPSLPPLPARPRERRRFSLAEEHAFGRWSVVDVGGRRRTTAAATGSATLLGGAPHQAPGRARGSRSASVPELHSVTAPAALLQAESSVASSVGSRASTPYCEVNGGEVDQVQAVLDRLLPAGAEAHTSPSPLLRAPSRQRRRSTGSCGTLTRTQLMPGQSTSASTARFQREALEQFRLRLLGRHRSLHDAFSATLANSSADKVAMGPRELRTSLARIGKGETDELFAASGMAWQGCTHTGITLLQFFHELVGVSAEALLWELRCSLTACHLWPWPSDPELLRSYLGSEAEKALLLDARTEATHGETAASAPAPGLGHDVWLHFCTQLGLTDVEAQWLYNMFKDEAGSVDISRLVDAVRATVSFDTSLMQLASKLLKSYGSVRDAFAAVTCKSSERVMRWREFQRLAFSLEISSHGAEKLWAALRYGAAVSCASVGEEDGGQACDQSLEMLGNSEDGFSEHEFVQCIVSWAPDLLRWSPDAVLHELERQLEKKFDGFPECRRSLRQHGLPGSFELSPRRLKAGLQAVGIARCDADVLLSKARSVLGKDSEDGQVTFDDIIQTIRDTSTGWSPGKSKRSDSSAGSVLRKEWQQLADVKCTTTKVDCAKLLSLPKSQSEPSTRSASLPSTRCPSVSDDSEWAAKDSSNCKGRRSSMSSSRPTSVGSVESTSIPSLESDSPEAAARERREKFGVLHMHRRCRRKSTAW